MLTLTAGMATFTALGGALSRRITGKFGIHILGGIALPCCYALLCASALRCVSRHFGAFPAFRERINQHTDLMCATQTGGAAGGEVCRRDAKTIKNSARTCHQGAIYLRARHVATCDPPQEQNPPHRAARGRRMHAAGSHHGQDGFKASILVSIRPATSAAVAFLPKNS